MPALGSVLSGLLMAPMAGANPVALAVAVAQAGGMGALGALLHDPAAMSDWVQTYRHQAGADAPLQINLWVPDPEPLRDAAHEARVRAFLAGFGPEVPAAAGDARPIDFNAQFDAVIAARPTAFSSIMGLLTREQVVRLKDAGIAWYANVTTVGEALAAEQAGADAIVAQGAEAGGHRGAFIAADAQARAVGLFALLPQVVDAVCVPVIATGGIADARGVAAALLLGAKAVQIGTALLRCDESDIAPSWRAALATARPEDTQLTRAFSGRWGRALATPYVQASASAEAPEPAPYPVQRGLTAAMRAAAAKADDLSRMQAWSGQAAALGQGGPAADWLRALWRDAQALLPARPA
jgi:nitronate monooxygenase